MAEEKPSQTEHITISERDEAGNLVATYIHSRGTGLAARDAGKRGGRVDIVWPDSPKPLARKLLDVFLPSGYPGSVTDDYLWYQIYDSLQAFSSSIAGLLSSRAVLEGVGVGNANATPTNALYLSIVQDSLGRIATIIFAYRFGTVIEPECKMYRLLADVFNDAAMILDCLSPAFPASIRVGILGGSSVLRALCGVAAGSAKGCLSAHFATCGNLGELNAKDSSQETVISLLGMMVGSLVVSKITSPTATWISLLLLLAVHLAMNYLAVRAVKLRSLNQQRANLVFSTILEEERVPGIHEISQREYIFARTGLLRWHGGEAVATCSIGASLRYPLRQIGPNQERQTGSFTEPDEMDLLWLLDLFKAEKYILWVGDSGHRKAEATIVLKKGAQPLDQLKGWVHALILARRASRSPTSASQRHLKSTDRVGSPTLLAETYEDVCRLFGRYTNDLECAGWDFGVSAGLETRPGVRVNVDDDSDLTGL